MELILFFVVWFVITFYVAKYDFVNSYNFRNGIETNNKWAYPTFCCFQDDCRVWGETPFLIIWGILFLVVPLMPITVLFSLLLKLSKVIEKYITNN